MRRPITVVAALCTASACAALEGLDAFHMEPDASDADVGPSVVPDAASSAEPTADADNTDATDAADGAVSCAAKHTLVIADGDVASANGARALLEERLFQVSVISNYTNDGGTAAADIVSAMSTVDAVLVLTATTAAMIPPPVQQALLDAHARGAGLVFEEWAPYEVSTDPGWAKLAPLMLYTYESDDYSATVELTYAPPPPPPPPPPPGSPPAPPHPVWAGLPTHFTTVAKTALGFGPRINNGEAPVTTIARATVTGSSTTIDKEVVFVRDGAGRIAQTGLAPNYVGENALMTDPNVHKLYGNMMTWVARCQ